MRRRSLLAAGIGAALAGCLGMGGDDPDPPETAGDDGSPFEIDPEGTNPLALAPARDDVPVVEDDWGADNTSYDHYPGSHTRRFRADDRSATFTATAFDSVDEGEDFLRHSRWTDESDAELLEHDIASAGYFYIVESSAHVVFRDANVAARVTYTVDSSGLFDSGVSDDEIEEAFEMAVAWHDTWR